MASSAFRPFAKRVTAVETISFEWAVNNDASHKTRRRADHIMASNTGKSQAKQRSFSPAPEGTISFALSYT